MESKKQALMGFLVIKTWSYRAALCDFACKLGVYPIVKSLEYPRNLKHTKQVKSRMSLANKKKSSEGKS